MDTNYDAIPRLEAVFDGARCFGLSEGEVWRAFDESVAEAGPDATVCEYIQELTGELARRILFKQRRSPSPPPCSSQTAGTGRAGQKG